MIGLCPALKRKNLALGSYGSEYALLCHPASEREWADIVNTDADEPSPRCRGNEANGLWLFAVQPSNRRHKRVYPSVTSTCYAQARHNRVALGALVDAGLRVSPIVTLQICHWR